MSMDSPGIKSGAEVMLSKVPMATDETDNEEYIYMKTTQNRYVKPPAMRLKLKEEPTANGNRIPSLSFGNDNFIPFPMLLSSTDEQEKQ